MKYLTVIRHAEALNLQPGEDDSARGLTNNGLAAAFRLGQLLAGKECIPDRVITSTARRARETANQICRAAHLGEEVVEAAPWLYENDVDLILDTLQAFPEDNNRIFLIGHNPSVTHLVNALCGAVVENMNAGSAVNIKLTGRGIDEGTLVFHIET